jgi:uncharacterized protein with beta-barrel porin domain
MVSLTNSGSFSVLGIASADADLAVHQQVRVSGVSQVARGLNALATIDNSGTITVAGSAQGTAVGSVSNYVAASGLNQTAWGPESVVASVDNSGSIDVSARAIGTAETGKATNVAIAGGISQNSLGKDGASSSVTNSGSISVVADAESNGGIVAFAGAYAEGFSQEPLFGTLTATLDNDGDIAVLAGASAVATGGAYASAKATGLHVDAANVVADVLNSGSFTVAASAVASGVSGSAYAFAGGISMTAANHGTSGSFGLISGTIENSGSLKVSAKVDSANSGTVGATATGIFLNSGQIDATVVNTGTILVQAVTANGGDATAYGVHAVNWYDPAVDGDAVFTFTNDGGTIVVRESVDGGTTWQRGNAIDLTEAPNSSVVNLLGDGAIYGNIAIQDGDVINVEDGTTLFDGIINPGSMPAGGITAADLDTGLSGPGTLNIDNGGNLELVSGNSVAAMDDGPSYVFVDTLNIGADGTITYDLPAVSGNAAVGTYPQVFTDVANLDGSLIASIQPANGLFADAFYDNVIDANVRNGEFESCGLAGPYTNSLLLDLQCVYDSKANVDLQLSRTEFGAVAGLNANGVAVGEGLECIYDVALTGGVADMLSDLFLFTDAANYNVALNMLSGSVYANYLNSFASLGVHENDLVDHATNCEMPALAGSVLECRSGGPIHVWGQLDYQTRKADGDIEAGDSRSKRFTGLLGIDANVGNAAIVGVDAGYLSNHFRDHQFGDTAKGDGWTVGAYAVYDPGTFFVKGVTTYSSLNGDATRHINFAGLAPGAAFAANPTGDPDVNMWTAGLHGGARLPMGASSVVTPYLNLDYVHAHMKGFTEDGGNGAGLTVEGANSNHAFATGGVKWATQMGGVVPEVNLGYRYRFGDQRSDFRAFFNGDSDCDFGIVSAAQKKGTFLAGLSVGGKVGPVDLRIGYEGEFNGDVTSHSGNFKVVLPLGGHAAPPPPAPVAAPPPPPPAPVVEQPAPPPPPPPAPVERGERGQ